MVATPWVSLLLCPQQPVMQRCSLAALDGALSCMKMTLLRRRKTVVSQELHIFHTFRDPKGTDRLHHLVSGPKHDSITPLLSQSCWTWCTNHPLLHLSGPSRGAQHSSVKIVSKWVFVSFWATADNSAWTLAMGGQIEGVCLIASLWRILHLRVPSRNTSSFSYPFTLLWYFSNCSLNPMKNILTKLTRLVDARIMKLPSNNAPMFNLTCWDVSELSKYDLLMLQIQQRTIYSFVQPIKCTLLII